MLGKNAFYYNIIRKYIVAFGSLFNDIHVIRSKTDGTLVKDITVPITFASKDKAKMQINSIHSRHNEELNIGAIIPRISYTLIGMEPDPTRVLNPLQTRAQMIDADDNSSTSILVGKPYNFNFQLSIWTKYQDDMFQIIEQALHFFNPEYTLTLKEIPEIGMQTNIPIILQSVQTAFETEFDEMSWRVIRFDMDFVVKGFIYPPITDDKIIEKIKLNYLDMNTEEKLTFMQTEFIEDDAMFYSAYVENTDSYYSAIDDGSETVKDYASISMPAYHQETEPTLPENYKKGLWVIPSTAKRYMLYLDEDGVQTKIEL